MIASRILTAAEMRLVDESADVPVDVLVERAGGAVAATALRMLGGTYGKSVVVLVGKGKNGADGRVAARILYGRGVRVHSIAVDRQRPAPAVLPTCDLVIDAVLGTGSSGQYVGPEQPPVPVLAVDIPSGLDATTGAIPVGSRVLRADHTVTFAALKPGLLLNDGPDYVGVVEVADIGLTLPESLGDVPGLHLAVSENVRPRLVLRARNAHKWSAALGVIGGSPGMAGAPSLVAMAALRSGTGMVRMALPGGVVEGLPMEAVRVGLPTNHWTTAAVEATTRCHALVVGPGLGRSRPTMASARALVLRAGQPLVVDADAFAALAEDVDDERSLEARATATTPNPPSSGMRAVQQAIARREGQPVAPVRQIDRTPVRLPAAVLRNRRPGSTVLTPHDGEFELLTGRRPGTDRVAAARELAVASGAVVLLKGPTTVIADQTGRAELVTIADERLATAGTGDVLAGLIGSMLAQGVGSFDAAVIGAYVHATAAARGRRIGMIASDLPELIADVLSAWV